MEQTRAGSDITTVHVIGGIARPSDSYRSTRRWATLTSGSRVWKGLAMAIKDHR